MHYYFRIIEKVTSGILDLFNDLQIKQFKFSKANNDWVTSYYTVPIEIATKDKILRESEQLYNSDTIKRYYNVPKMALMLNSISKNDSKQTNQLNVVKNSVLTLDEDGKKIMKYIRNPSWWTANYSLFILTRRMDDTTQIFEQILPVFQPQRSLNIKLIPEINLNVSLEVTINNNINFELSNELDPEQIRFINSQIDIVVPLPMFPPISDSKIIERIILRFGSVKEWEDLPLDETQLEEFNLYGERLKTNNLLINNNIIGNWSLIRESKFKPMSFNTYIEEE